jgi:hypothetical protein
VVLVALPFELVADKNRSVTALAALNDERIGLSRHPYVRNSK